MNTSPYNRGDSDIPNPAQEIEGLVLALQQFGDSQPEGQAYRILAETVTYELMTVADRSKNYSEALEVIHSHQQQTTLFGSILGEILTNLEQLEQARIRREKYSLRWWEQTVQALQRAFDENPEIAYQQWLSIYAQALVDWEIETCSRLANTSFLYPQDKYPYVLLIRHGNASLQDKDYPATLEMLKYMVDQLSEAKEADQHLLGALLSIFIGRILLYQMDETELAYQAFDRAGVLAPYDGRPLASRGHIALEEGADGLAEANRLFSRSIEFSPNQPEGYVGKAMIAEKRGLWSEADEWYKKAVQKSIVERDALRFLSRMLAPGSGRLYLHLAHWLLNDNSFDGALDAVELCQEYGLEDGSQYPNRSAIALKANILATASGPDRIPEEAKTIGDLYLDAGRNYYWNEEYQTAIDLLKKSHNIYRDNSLPLFYLSAALLMLSYLTTPPYTDVKLVHESLANWEAGINLLDKTFDPNTAWVYMIRSRIASQLDNLSNEDSKENSWQAILFSERALVLRDNPDYWSYLAFCFNGLDLYANMLYLLKKALREKPEDTFNLQELTKVLINTGQFQQARPVLEKLLKSDKVKPEEKIIYQSWLALVDYYQGEYLKALENLEPALRLNPNDMWTIALRSGIYRAMGKVGEALKDEMWIWDQRDNQDYSVRKYNFAWAAYRLGMFQDAIDLAKPFLESISRFESATFQELVGLSYLAMGDVELANDFLSKALDTCINPRVLFDIVTDLEQLERRSLQESWPLHSEITSYLNKPGSILKRAKSKQKKTKAYRFDPVVELKNILSDPVTGKPGSSSWLSAQFGLARLQLEANNMEAAKKAYQALSLYPQAMPEASIGIGKIKELG